MPEGPEIKWAARRIAKAVEGKVCVEVEIAYEPIASMRGELDGQTIVSVSSHSKALLITFESGIVMYSHNQLYGRWMIRKTRNYPESRRTLRVGLHTEKTSALLYSATDIEFMPAEELSRHPYIENLGPDILAESFTPQTALEQLESKRFRNRQLAALYLDQSFLAGPGNYLRCEILFEAGVSPLLRPSDLKPKRLKALAEATDVLAQRALETKGCTTPEELRQRLKEEGCRRREYRHYVYGREGRPCHQCQTPVTRINKGGRGLYYCSTCQGGSRR